MLDRWRQNWAAWYHNFDVPMTAGKPREVRIEWIPNDGYIALLHNDPLPDAERHSLTFTSDVGPRRRLLLRRRRDRRTRSSPATAQLTGKAVMLPRWAYGFWQSRQRYTTQDELFDVVARIPQAQHPARQHRAGLVLLEGRPLGLARIRQGALPGSEGHDRRGARAERAAS